MHSIVMRRIRRRPWRPWRSWGPWGPWRSWGPWRPAGHAAARLGSRGISWAALTVLLGALLTVLLAGLLAAGRQAPARAAARHAASAAQGRTAADWALHQLGKPYQWAAAGPRAFDCSGLTMRAWQHAGVRLGHFTGFQWTSGPHIPLNKLRSGDLVFFATNTAKPSTIHHVGIYIGHHKMVDAPHTGADVRIDTIYEPGLIGATRPWA